MIRYIFKSKPKNILVAVIAALYFIATLDYLHSILLTQSYLLLMRWCATALPPLLIFIYMCTLKREFKIKNWIIPTAFAISTTYAVYRLTSSYNAYPFLGITTFLLLLAVLIAGAVSLLGNIFCFLGALFNFKKISFFRIGNILCIIGIVVSTVLETYLNLLYVKYATTLGAANEFLYFVNLLKNSWNTFAVALLPISLLLLTITKKSDDIDINHFTEERKAKKAKRLQAKMADTFVEPVVSEGHWRCMGCGEILPDTQTACDCGYKKQN